MRELQTAVTAAAPPGWREASDLAWGEEWGSTLRGILYVADTQNVQLPADLLPTVERWLGDRSHIMIAPATRLEPMRDIVARQCALAHAL